jgi:dipeptidyl aminopeptidase/acylaminoacyl peptidase
MMLRGVIRSAQVRAALLFFALAHAVVTAAHGQGSAADYERAASFDRRTAGKVLRERLDVHWFPDGNALWYRRDLANGGKEIVRIDALTGDRELLPEPPATDSESLTPRPSRADSSSETMLRFVNRSGEEIRLFWIDPAGRRQSYGTVPSGETREQHTFAGHVWIATDSKNEVLGVFEGEERVIDAIVAPHSGQKPRRSARDRNSAAREQAPHPWRTLIRDDNVWIKNGASGEEVQLSTGGTADNAYGDPVIWAPDGKHFVALQTKPAQERKVYLVESSPAEGLQPRLHDYNYLKPGDRIAESRPRLFDIEKRAQINMSDELFSTPWRLSGFHWSNDNSHFFFEYNQRGHQLFRVIDVDAASGEARALIEERSATFIDYSQKHFIEWLDDSRELIWMSERDGWNHLYLIDAQSGAVKNQITRGEWVVRDVDRIDAKARQIWLRVMGYRRGEDPYHSHLARVNFDGTGFAILTEGDGTHKWEWSPDRRFFVDTWSRVDQPPVHELRRATDGQRVCELERADITALQATGWSPPERFMAKGRDGKTEIFGIVFRPSNFDPARKYPVIEKIYAGPHDFFVPKSWNRFPAPHGIAELGFVVVQIDGMGTNWRSRAFHDVCWKNLRDAGFPDRIAWMRAAAGSRPWMDLERVGVFGGSAGGQSALGALLFHGDFYKAAVADCGCHDNRMDKIWWNEAWMGWPVGPEYAENSNVTHAAQLRGKLLLTVGELDRNVDPSSTMQVVNALIKANKDFDLLIVPGAGHGAGDSAYGRRRRDDFFVRHLLGVEPRHTGN